MKAKTGPSRIGEIVAEMSSITEFAQGSIVSSSSSYATNDGKRHKTRPQFKFQCRGGRGKNGDEAHSRQLRVMNFFEYCSVDGKGTPIPIRGSFSYAVTDGDIAETTGLLKVQGVARGSGTAPRMQCVADGEEALEKALRDTFPFAEFTNDVMHACGYLSACCQTIGIASPAKEYATCRRIMFRDGAGSAVDRIRRHYPGELEASEEARAARILVARRCKQAGMHWRHHNAACVCAIIARLRSAA